MFPRCTLRSFASRSRSAGADPARVMCRDATGSRPPMRWGRLGVSLGFVSRSRVCVQYRIGLSLGQVAEVFAYLGSA